MLRIFESSNSFEWGPLSEATYGHLPSAVGPKPFCSGGREVAVRFCSFQGTMVCHFSVQYRPRDQPRLSVSTRPLCSYPKRERELETGLQGEDEGNMMSKHGQDLQAGGGRVCTASSPLHVMSKVEPACCSSGLKMSF